MIIEVINFKEKSCIVDCIRDIIQSDGAIHSIEQTGNDLVFDCNIDLAKFNKTATYKLT